MKFKQAAKPPTNEPKPPFRVRAARFFGRDISETNIRYLLVQRKRSELIQLAKKYEKNPEKLDKIATIIYDVIKKPEDPEIAGKPREIGLEVRKAIMEFRFKMHKS